MTVRDLPATGAEPQGPSADCVLNSEKYSAASARQRLARAAADNFQFLWRSLRRLGIRPDAAVDDAVQRVFEIAARKVDRVEAGLERAFLFRTAMFVAAEERRGQRRVRDRATEIDPLELAAPEPDPEQALTQRRTREYLDRVLAALPMELRTVFILFELEGLTAVQIGALLDVPEGTASSRLRRARQLFHEEARRLRARIEFRGGERLTERDSPSGHEPDAFERALLDSARNDAGSPRALARAMAVWGGVASAVSSAGAAAAVGSGATATMSPAGSTLLVAAKWTCVGLLGGFIAVGTVSRAVQPRQEIRAAEPSPAASTAGPDRSRMEPPMSADLPVPIAPSEPPQTHSSPPRRPGEQNTAALPGGPTVPMPGTPAIAAFPASDPQTASSLSRELAELERARGALTSGKPKRAVEILEAYDATFPRGTLWQEATLLHVEARLRVGEVERAREVARRVLNVEPGGPHSVRVRSLFEHSAVDRN